MLAAYGFPGPRIVARLDRDSAEAISSGIPTALIIGNSDGIGLALTELLLDEGWNVVGVSRSPSPLEKEPYGHSIADVTKPEYETVLNEIVSAARVDVCVYCPSIGQQINAETGLGLLLPYPESLCET